MFTIVYSLVRAKNQVLPLFRGGMVLLLSLWGNTAMSFASQSPSKVIAFTADSILFDKKNQRMIFQGHIVLKQKDRQLTAERLVIYINQQGHIAKMIATGHPAAYRAAIFSHRSPLIAMAKTIYYYPLTDQLDAEGNAQIRQGQNHFTGPRLHYDFKRKTMGTVRSTQGHTRILLAPIKALRS